jgi:hypothetical protein
MLEMCGHHCKTDSEVFQASGIACRLTCELGKLGHCGRWLSGIGHTRSEVVAQAEVERELILPAHNTESIVGITRRISEGAPLLLDDLAM